MKKGMILFAAVASICGAACSTYTSSTDPDDFGTGYAVTGEKVGTGSTGSFGVAEANNNATLDNPATVKPDSTAASPAGDSTTAKPAADSAAARPTATTGGH